MMYIEPILNVDNKQQLRQIINDLVYQISSNTSQVTLNGTSTSITNIKIYEGTVILLSPRNAQAMNTRYFISEVGQGQAVIEHSSTSGALFDVVLMTVK